MDHHLTYHLGSEERKGKHFLSIQVQNHGSMISVSLLKGLVASLSDPKERSALQWILQEHERLSLTPLLPLLIVSANKAQEAMKLLSLTRRLYWNGERVVLDPFVSLTFFIYAKQQEGGVALEGKWQGAGGEGSFCECDGLFLSDPPLVLKHGTIYLFEGQIDLKWYALIYPRGLTLPLSDFQKMQLDWIDEGDFAPALRWAESPVMPIEVEPLPYLKLTDRTGAFGNLWMDYGVMGQVDIEDPLKKPWRKKTAERSWEKDLLETDFLKKQVGSSSYYCPLNRVAKSLTFLLEIGWKIVDHHNRQVVQQQKEILQADITKECVIIKGSIVYSSHLACVVDVLGAFNRREQFISLDPSTVGLIDHDVMEERFGSLDSHEIVADQIVVKKTRIGILETLWDHVEIASSPSLTTSLANFSGRLEKREHLPTNLFCGKLFPYQQLGVDWLCFLKSHGLSGLLADEMGLGKTVQVLAFFSHLSFNIPSLVVVPTSLLFNWRREIEHFLPSLKLYVHHGKERLNLGDEIKSYQIILTSYALLRQDAALFQSVCYELIVLDEGQLIKNSESQTALIAFQLQSEMRLVLSGTPIENRWEDLWSLFNFLIPKLLGDKKEFSSKMSAAASDHRYLLQTQRKTRPFLLRRKKQDVALELPEKIIQTVWVEMTDTQRSLYEEWMCKNRQGLLKKLAIEGGQAQRMEVLEAILRLRQLCCHPWLVDGGLEGELLTLSAKLDRLMADIAEVVAEGKKVLVYSQFTQMLQLIQKLLAQQEEGYVYLDGSTQDREEVVRRFQEDENIKIFLISLKAGGVGLNLTAADYVFIYDPWWNEAVENQAIDRAHRLGRRDVVIARRYITAFSIEEKLMKLKEHKRSLSEGLLGDCAELSPLTFEDLKMLLT